MLDIDFVGDPAPGWTVTIDQDLTTARITGPGGLGEIYSVAAEKMSRSGPENA